MNLVGVMCGCGHIPRSHFVTDRNLPYDNNTMRNRSGCIHCNCGWVWKGNAR